MTGAGGLNGLRSRPTGGRFHELIRSHASTQPDACAVSGPDATLTYGELARLAHGVAAQLRSLGVRDGTPVGLCLPRTAALVVGALGILEAGGVYVAMDPAYPSERLEFMLSDSGADLVLTDGYSIKLPDPIRVVPVSTVPPVDASLAAVAPARLAVDGLAYVVYTSGSSGTPKGVMVGRGSLDHLVDWHIREFGLTAADRTTQIASPGFDAAVWEIWPALAAGASIHIPDPDTRVDPVKLRDWLLTTGVTVSFLPTPLAEAVLALHWPGESSLRHLLTGGDVLSRRPPAGLPFSVVNNYGLTEATVVSTSGTVNPDRDDPGRPSIGLPIDGIELRIVDSSLNPIMDGSEGEVLLGGPMLAYGYVGLPGQTADRFIPDHLSAVGGQRLYRTGDRARRLLGGEIEFLGRLDDQVQIRGFRIEPSEVAAAIMRHPAVRSAVVSASRTGQQLIAYVVPVGPELAAADLTSFVSATLPPYMIPAAFAWLDELPLTLNGKVDHSALSWPWPIADGAEPASELEVALMPLVAGLVGRERVGVDEDFFQIGGHSLLGAQLVYLISERFGVDVPLGWLFENATVAEMARLVERLLIEDLESLSEEEVAKLAAELPDDGARS